MRSLHPGVITMALNNALWSREEELILSKILSVRFRVSQVKSSFSTVLSGMAEGPGKGRLFLAQIRCSFSRMKT